jgi:shikimate kinase
LKKRSGIAAGLDARIGVRRRPARKHKRTAAPNAIFLVGFMGAGKTSVGRALAQRLHWLFEDLDDRIVRRQGRSVAEIFRDSGEPEFRRAEHAALQDLLEELRGAGGRIVALGGGAFVQKKNAALLQAAGVPTVFLDAPVDELWQRCYEQSAALGTERPLLRNPEQFRKLYNARRKGYSRVLTRIQTGNRSVDAIAAEIVATFGLTKIAIRTEQGEVE